MKSLLEISKELNLSKQKIYRYYKKYLLPLKDTYSKIGETIYLNEKGENKIKQYFDIKIETLHAENDAHQSASLKNEANTLFDKNSHHEVLRDLNNDIHQITSNHINDKNLPKKNSESHQDFANKSNCITSHHINVQQNKEEIFDNDNEYEVLRNKKNDTHHITSNKNESKNINKVSTSFDNLEDESHHTNTSNHINSKQSIEGNNDNTSHYEVHHDVLQKSTDDVHHITSNETTNENLIQLMQTTINELSLQLQKKDKQIDDLSRLLENTQKLQLQLQLSTLEAKSTSFDDNDKNEKKSLFAKFFSHKKK